MKRNKMTRITCLVLSLLMLLGMTSTAFAKEDDVEPRGNLASIYKSTTPYYGTDSTYSVLTGTRHYNAALTDKAVNITKGAFATLVTAVCPPLGAAVGGGWLAADALGALYDVITYDPVKSGTRAIYVKVECYAPPTQPSPYQYEYTKYVVSYYSDPNYVQNGSASDMTDTYYQMLKYRLDG